MKTRGHWYGCTLCLRRGGKRLMSALIAAALFGLSPILSAQQDSPDNLAEQIQKLTDAMTRTQAQLEESQRQLDEMRAELAALQRQLAQGQPGAPAAPAEPDAASVPAAAESQTTRSAIEDLRERQAMVESQLSTHEQTKVESQSKFPVRITGLLLFNGFVNTSQVDMPETPTVALGGAGSTGASVRQTILGFDAHGPHLFGAQSYADLRVDFEGSPNYGSTGSGYSGVYGYNSAILRLRTAHAGLRWDRTETYFSLDRPIVSPDTPTSLTAVAEPALAWSGNLWTWNPQLGITRDIGVGGSHTLRLQSALIDVGNAPSFSFIPGGTATDAEQSRWPGVESRIALLGATDAGGVGNHLGFGGYFAPHRDASGYTFQSWAGTLDSRLRLPAHFEFSGSAYRGLALGGLGAGAFKDFVARMDVDTGGYYYRALDNVGGWAQLKERISERLELNAALGFDQDFARQLRRYAVSGGSMYQNLARNRTFTGNVIYSPTAYLLFSLEYRHLDSSPVVGTGVQSNVVGVAAGYKF